MVQNGHSVILFPNWLLSNIIYGTKWLWCKIHMVRNGFWQWYEIAISWYEMVNYGMKWQWYEMVMVRNDTCFRGEGWNGIWEYRRGSSVFIDTFLFIQTHYRRWWSFNYICCSLILTSLTKIPRQTFCFYHINKIFVYFQINSRCSVFESIATM
jgi:hypothetical protein